MLCHPAHYFLDPLFLLYSWAPPAFLEGGGGGQDRARGGAI